MRSTICLLLIPFIATIAAAQPRSASAPSTKPAAKEVKAAEELLKSKGLTRVGTLCLLDEDARISELLKPLAPSEEAARRLRPPARRKSFCASSTAGAQKDLQESCAKYRVSDVRRGVRARGASNWRTIDPRVEVLYGPRRLEV